MSTLRESEGRKRIERLHQGYPLLLSLGKRESNQGHSSASFFFAPTLPPKQKFCICFRVHQPTSSDKPQLACYSTLNAHLGLEGKASESSVEQPQSHWKGLTDVGLFIRAEKWGAFLAQFSLDEKAIRLQKLGKCFGSFVNCRKKDALFFTCFY